MHQTELLIYNLGNCARASIYRFVKCPASSNENETPLHEVAQMEVKTYALRPKGKNLPSDQSASV